MSEIKLVSFDLDGTLFKIPTFYHLCKKMGKENEVEKLRQLYSHDKKKRRDEVHKLVVCSLDDVKKYLEDMPTVKNIAIVVRKLKERGMIVVILSDVPTVVSEYMKKYGFDDVIGSIAIVKDNMLVGESKFLEDKYHGLLEYCRKNGIEPKECVHVGNDFNDITVFQNAGHSIAFNPISLEVEKNARHVVRSDDLLEVYKILQQNIFNKAGG
ncbi:MAG TPA: HAD-IB family phosphatase [archaeon]|nr:HAD-IB family phosphatase [archaeon]